MVSTLVLIIVMAIPIPSTLTSSMSVPYNSEDVNTSSLEMGQAKTTQIGSNGMDIIHTHFISPLFAYIFGLKNSSYSRSAPQTNVVKQPVTQLIAQGTMKYQYMWCSNGSYRYYTNTQFKNPTIGFTHASPDDCAKNNEGKETQLANTPPSTQPTASVAPSSNLINIPALTVPTCTTTSIPYGVDYQDASWLPTGQSQTSPGLDGTYYSCLDTSVPPVNEIIYTGTGTNYNSVNQQATIQAAKEQCQQQYQSAMAQIDAAGAGDSSATIEAQQLYQQCLAAAG